MPLAFLDTSIVLRRILGEPGAYPKLERFEKLYAGDLLRVEALRTIDRLRIQNHWTHEEIALRIRLLTAVMNTINTVPLQPPILRRASEPFSVTVGTLDALHIATAILAMEQLKKPFLFLTHDAKQGVAAQAAGFHAEGF